MREEKKIDANNNTVIGWYSARQEFISKFSAYAAAASVET